MSEVVSGEFRELIDMARRAFAMREYLAIGTVEYRRRSDHEPLEFLNEVVKQRFLEDARPDFSQGYAAAQSAVKDCDTATRTTVMMELVTDVNSAMRGADTV